MAEFVAIVVLLIREAGVDVGMLLVKVTDPISVALIGDVAFTLETFVAELRIALEVEDVVSVPLPVTVGRIVVDPEAAADPESVAVVVRDPDTGVEVGDVRGVVVPESVVVELTPDEPRSVVTLPEALKVELGAADSGMLLSTVVVGTLDPAVRVALPNKLPAALVTEARRAVEVPLSVDDARAVELPLAVLGARMLERMLAKSAEAVVVGELEDIGVTRDPVDAAADEGSTPLAVVERTDVPVVVDDGEALFGVVEIGVLDAESVVVVLDEGTKAVPTFESTEVSAEIRPEAALLVAAALAVVVVESVPVDDPVPENEPPELDAVVAAVDPALPVKEMPDETEVEVPTSVVVLEELTTPPGPNVIALPLADEVVVGKITLSGTDPLEATDDESEDDTVGRITTVGEDPVESAVTVSLVVVVAGSAATMVVFWITTVVTVSSLLELAVGVVSKRLLKRFPVVPADPEDDPVVPELDEEVPLVPVISDKKSDNEPVVDLVLIISCELLSVVDSWGMEDVMVEFEYVT